MSTTFLVSSQGSAPARPAVLVVDPCEPVGRVVAELLAGLGYQATACRTADEALKLLAGLPFDAVLAEVGQHTETGQSLAACLSTDFPEVPVAMLTGWLDHPETSYIDQHGVRLVLRKPIRADRLEVAVRAMLDGFRARQPKGWAGEG